MKATKDIISKEQGNNKSYKLSNFYDLEDGSWSAYDDAEEFLNFINPISEECTLTIQDSEVHHKALSFYDGVSLIQVSSFYDDDDMNLFFLKHGDDFIMLDGNSAVIHEINASGILKLNQDNIFDYLKFFNLFVAADEEGEVFYVVEGPDSEFLKGASAYISKRALRKYTGPRVIGSADSKSFFVETRVIHCGELYDAKYKILSSGDVSMKDDEYVGVW